MSTTGRERLAEADARRLWLLCAGFLCAASLLVFRGALALFFAQEDFRGLAVAAGLMPRAHQLWRYVSVQAFMDVFFPLFGDRAAPYHAVSLGFHALNAVLLFTLCARHLSKPAALVGATFYAVHPALFTAVSWQSERGDLLAVSFALLAVLLALRSGASRWLAVPAFALSLLSKESTLGAPAVVALMGWRPPANRARPVRRWRLDPLALALLAESALYLLVVMRSNRSGNGVGFDPSSAYGFDFGAGFVGNLLTYLGWTVDLAMSAPGLRFMDRQNPALAPLGLTILAGVALISAWPGLRRRPWLIGVVGFFALLLPVLPFRNHAYHHFLYAPLAAAGLCVGTIVDSLARPRSPERVESAAADPRPRAGSEPWPPAFAWLIAGLCCAALTWNGARLVDQIARQRSPSYPLLHADPVVDRSLIAERAFRTIRAAAPPRGTRLMFVMRERVALLGRIARGAKEAPPPAQEVYTEANVRVALFGGMGVRALVPAIDSVAFVTRLRPLGPAERYAVYAPTGEVELHDQASMDSLLASPWITRW